jgi:AcrR family transcriptional regulator
MTPMPRGTTARGRERRRLLLTAAADLVAERGFHSVGIAEIGAAVGVSGSAMYRHFKDKTDLLVALFDDVVDILLERASRVTSLGHDDHAVLDALIEHHVEFALRERALIQVYSQESQNLPAEDRIRLRRNQRSYASLWAVVLQRLRPELTDEDGRARVHATFGLINSVSNYKSRLSKEALRPTLRSMAKAALLSA